MQKGGQGAADGYSVSPAKKTRVCVRSTPDTLSNAGSDSDWHLLVGDESALPAIAGRTPAASRHDAHPSIGPSSHNATLMVTKDSTVASSSAAAHMSSKPYFCARIG